MVVGGCSGHQLETTLAFPPFFLFPSEADLPPSCWEMVGRSTHPTALENIAKGGSPRSESRGEKPSAEVGTMRSGSHGLGLLSSALVRVWLRDRWWACLPTPQAPLSKGAALLWGCRNRTHFLFGASTAPHLSSRELREGQRSLVLVMVTPPQCAVTTSPTRNREGKVPVVLKPLDLPGYQR